MRRGQWILLSEPRYKIVIAERMKRAKAPSQVLQAGYEAPYCMLALNCGNYAERKVTKEQRDVRKIYDVNRLRSHGDRECLQN
jgi:hypothetical protein